MQKLDLPELPEKNVVLNKEMTADPAKVLAHIFRTQKDADTFVVERAKIVTACKALQTAGYEHLTSITAIDWKKSWEVVYHIAKFGRKEMVALKVTLPYQ